MAAAELTDHPENITVVNTRTLCGPHRHLVEQALEMVKQGSGIQEIVASLEQKMDTAKSFLIPADFDYLRRGGRLSPLVSYVGKAINLTPIMTQTADGTRLTIASIRRGFSHAIKWISQALKSHGVGKNWNVYISHADVLHQAEEALSILKAKLPEANFHILPLSPAFITQGGPGCVAVQIIEA